MAWARASDEVEGDTVAELKPEFGPDRCRVGEPENTATDGAGGASS
jgi:hypothetical protein